MTRSLDSIVSAAIANGLLPEGACIEQDDKRPWPVVALSAAGAWLAALPLLGILLVMMGDSLLRQPEGGYVIGPALIALCVTVLRASTRSIFLEQAALPGMLVGGLQLGVALAHDLSPGAAAYSMAAVAASIAYCSPRDWLRVVPGFFACAFFIVGSGTVGGESDHWSLMSGWANLLIGGQAATVLWAVLEWRFAALGRTAETGLFLDRVSSGWVVAVLVALSVFSGRTFLLGSTGGDQDMRNWLPFTYRPADLAQTVSMLMTVAALALGTWRWPSLRKAYLLPAAAAVLYSAMIMPALGAIVLVVSICATESKRVLAIAATCAAAWIVGGFYYRLSMPLSIKGAIFMAAATLFAASSWWPLRASIRSRKPAIESMPTPMSAKAAMIAGCVAALVVVNVGVWQKQDLIAHSKPVFIELAPVDPRSLMQGDYMALRFNMPALELGSERRPGTRMFAVAKVDQAGIATLTRYDDGTRLGKDEMLVELTYKGGQFIIASDAWYFAEGEGERWAKAKYGEFRVNDRGTMLLVGMRGPHLEAL